MWKVGIYLTNVSSVNVDPAKGQSNFEYHVWELWFRLASGFFTKDGTEGHFIILTRVIIV